MTEAERQLLQEFAQTRIESHYSHYLSSIDPDAIQAEKSLYDRLNAICTELSADDQKVAEEFDTLMFQRMAEKEQFMYYAGFHDGIRVGRILHDMEEKPLKI